MASNGLQMLSVPVDIKKTAFNWVEDGWVSAPDVEVVAVINTWHKYGYPGFFKPSIGEVASQIPGELVGKVDCFMTEFAGLEEPFHVGRTTLFRWKR